MVHIVFFYAVLLGACSYAGRAGGAPERCVAVILVAGTIATWAVAIGWRGAWLGHFRTVEYGILLVDCLMLAALLVVAMVADRFWPLWMTAIHGFGVVAHLAKAIAPDILPGGVRSRYLENINGLRVHMLEAGDPPGRPSCCCTAFRRSPIAGGI